MVEYYREAIFEAVIYCMSNGLSEEYVVSLDIYGFGEIYKYLKRIDARKQLKFVSDVSMAFGASKKQFKEYRKMIEVWLPTVELSSGGSEVKGKKGFAKRCQKGF